MQPYFFIVRCASSSKSDLSSRYMSAFHTYSFEVVYIILALNITVIHKMITYAFLFYMIFFARLQ